MLRGLALIQLGSIEAGVAMCQKSIELDLQKSHDLDVANARLMLAEAHWGHKMPLQARELATLALVFFESIGNWETTWRCLRILEDSRAKEVLNRGRKILGQDLYGIYLKRPIIKTQLT